MHWWGRMKIKRDLYIYGTVYNNEEYIAKCINSINNLNSKKIVIVDAGSTDGTLRELKKLGITAIEAGRCTRGKGRQIALEHIYKIAHDDDLAMYIDLDTVYSKDFILLMKNDIKKANDNEVYLGMLTTIRTNKKIPWRNLNVDEDWERMAHMYYLGIKPKRFIEKGNAKFGINRDEEKPYYIREMHYGSRYRLFKNLIDEHRGIAYKSWSGSSVNGNGSLVFLLANYVAHFIAKILGTYDYDNNLDNKQIFENAFKIKL
jgi:glycosyltransferase involved in cell wall biosynthesis